MNIQYAIKNDIIYVLEVNRGPPERSPLSARRPAFPGQRWLRRSWWGNPCRTGITKEIEGTHIAVKESVFPFNRFYGVDTVLGPEMKSTGEVMGIDMDFGLAFAKSQMARRGQHPSQGKGLHQRHEQRQASHRFYRQEADDLDLRSWRPRGQRRFWLTTGFPYKPFSRWGKQAGYRRPDQKRRDRPCHQYPSGKKPKADRVTSEVNRWLITFLASPPFPALLLLSMGSSLSSSDGFPSTRFRSTIRRYINYPLGKLPVLSGARIEYEVDIFGSRIVIPGE